MMKKLENKIHIKVEVTDTGFSAYSDDVSVYTTGENSTHLYENVLEAVNMAMEENGYYVTSENLRLELDLQQFFQHYKVLNANFLAKKIGMNPTLLSQYVRGIKSPSTKQVHKIIEGIQSIGQELASVELK